MKKRSYLLFELLLSFFLLSCALLPMMKTHFVVMKKENERLEKIQLERIQENAFAVLRQKLHENQEMPFPSLKKGCSGTLPHTFTIYKSKTATKTYTAHYDIKPLENCRRKSIHENYLLVEATLTFVAQNKSNHHSFSTTFLLREYE